MLWHQWHLLGISSHSLWQIALSTTNVTLSDLVLAACLSHLVTGSVVTRASVLLMLHPFHLLEMDSSMGVGNWTVWYSCSVWVNWFTSFWIYMMHRLIPVFWGLLYWGPWRIYKVRLGKWASVSIRAPFWGAWGDAPFLGPSREGWDFFLSEEILLQNSRDISKKALEMGSYLHQAPRWGTWRGFIYWDFWEADKGGLWSISY